MPLNFNALSERAGIVFAAGYRPQELTPQLRAQVHAQIAQDSELVTAPNAGIPSLFTTYVDPKVIEVLVTPMKMASVFGERKMGDWVSQTVTFLMEESTGEVSTYGDYSNNGQTGVNLNFPQRQPYHYQTVVEVGEREVEMAGAAKFDWVAAKQRSAILTLNKYQNKTYLYGVEGLKNYGYLNDPNLLPNLVSGSWATLGAEEIYDAIAGKLFTQLVKQNDGNVDRETSMTMTLSPLSDAYLTKTNQFKVNVTDLLTKNFPNLKIKTIPELTTAAGEMVKLVVDDYEGQPTLELSFTEKMRVHQMIPALSSWMQKRSQGTNGCVVYRPLMVVSMLVS